VSFEFACPEFHHPLIQSLFRYSDRDLLTLFQRYPDRGKYFTALFCRYGPVVYSLIHHGMKSPVQADYLFALTWRHIYHEMLGLDIHSETSGEAFSLQNWLVDITGLCINQTELPPTEEIHYSLEAAPPPLWCYVQFALNRLPPRTRLMVIMAQTFRWSETRIAAYLQAEGENISPAQVRQELQQGYQMLEAELPEDIRDIYLQSQKQQNSSDS
jgi:hypothetical protein